MSLRHELITALRDANIGFLPGVGTVYNVALSPLERDTLIQALEALKPSAAPEAARTTISPTEVSVRKFKVWVESCDRGSFPKDSPSDLAIKAQISVLRQLLEYLSGDDYLRTHVEHANKPAPQSSSSK